MATSEEDEQLHWACPICIPTFSISRYTQAALDISTSLHIRSHEHKAEALAVDRARNQCPSTQCTIGTNRTYNQTTHEWEPRLTEYDKKLLDGMKIVW